MNGDFDFNKINDFDDHINHSIPNYDILQDAIKSISRFYQTNGSNVYDIGCSTGRLLREIDHNGLRIGYDISNLIPTESTENLIYKKIDLIEDFEIENASVVFSIFTLQFIPFNYRLKILQAIYKGLNEGGILIITEKIIQPIGRIENLMTFSYYDYKSKNFDYSQIMQKEKSLRTVMHPLEEDENRTLFLSAGFDSMYCFYQMFNFKGWILTK